MLLSHYYFLFTFSKPRISKFHRVCHQTDTSSIRMQAGSSGEVRSVVGAIDMRGKHRIAAELKRLEQETRFLEEELELVEKTGKVSFACEELLSSIETTPDPLLPMTCGPTHATWDRWFEGPQDASGCRCCIL